MARKLDAHPVRFMPLGNLGPSERWALALSRVSHHAHARNKPVACDSARREVEVAGAHSFDLLDGNHSMIGIRNRQVVGAIGLVSVFPGLVAWSGHRDFTGGGFPPFSPVRPPFGHQIIVGSVVSYSK